MALLQISLFGRFQLIYDHVPVHAIQQRRQHALLAYLLLHRDILPLRQEIAFLFWPDVPERHAFTNLRKALHRLRNTLPEADQFLHIEAQTLGWQPEASFSLDVTDFEQNLAEAQIAWRAGYAAQAGQLLKAAVDLYEGDLLPYCYDDWLLPVRERLRQQFSDAVARLLNWQEEQRDYGAAIRTAERLLRHDPLHEATYRQLMQLHLLNGEAAEALRVYHTCATVLQQELNVSPSPATQAIYERIVSKTRIELKPTEAVHHRPMLPLVGRQAAWRHLFAAWLAVEQGPRLVIIAGEAGMGKTRLAEELLGVVNRQGFSTARSRAYEVSENLAYAPVTTWLRSNALRLVWSGLEKVWLTEIARLLPELLTQQPDLPPPPPLTESWQRHRLFEALARAVLQVDLPLLLVLDDLQWCDHETLEWLGYLLRFEPQAHLLVVGAVRPEEIDEAHPLTALLRDLRQSGLVTQIELGPLDAAETAELAAQVAQRTLEAGVAAQLYQDTEGNPLFIVETLRAGYQAAPQAPPEIGAVAPPRVQAVIEARLGQLSAPARDLVNLAAVIGREFTFEVLAAASSADTETLVNALDEAWQRRIFREQSQNLYDFSHDKIRDIAYAGLSAARRRWLHHTVAQAIEAVSGSNLDPVSSRLAYHYEQADQLEATIQYYWQAAQVGRAVCALPETITYLTKGQALLSRLPDTPGRTQQALNYLAMLGASFAALKGYAAPEAGMAYTQALSLLPQVKDSPQAVPIRFGLWFYHYVRAEFSQAQALGAQLLAEAQHQNDPTLLMLGHHALGATYFYTGQLGQARGHLEQSLARQPFPIQPDIHNPSLVNLGYLAITLWFQGYPGQARRRIEAVLDLARPQGNPIEHIIIYGMPTWFYTFMGEADLVQEYVPKALAGNAQYDLVYWRGTLTQWQGWAAVKKTRQAAGIATMRQGLADLVATGAQANVSQYLFLLAESYQVTGQLQAGLETLQQALDFVNHTNERLLEAELYRLKGELLLALAGDQRAEAEACLQRALAIARRQQAKALELRAATSLARWWQQQGQREAARTLLAECYHWFSEGFETHDLKAAKALLDKLS